MDKQYRVWRITPGEPDYQEPLTKPQSKEECEQDKQNLESEASQLGEMFDIPPQDYYEIRPIQDEKAESRNKTQPTEA